MMLFAFFYLGTAYLTSYGTSPHGAGLPRPVVLAIGVGAAVVFGVAIVVSGVLSDRFGRRKVIMTSCGIGIGWALVLFPLLDTGSVFAFAAGLTITLVIFGIAYGPAGSFLPELFRTRYRYTGAGLGYNLAGVLGGAVPPLISQALAASFGSIAIGVMLSVIGVISMVCTALLAETATRTLAEEPEPAAAEPVTT
jgi:MFS family permease